MNWTEKNETKAGTRNFHFISVALYAP